MKPTIVKTTLSLAVIALFAAGCASQPAPRNEQISYVGPAGATGQQGPGGIAGIAGSWTPYRDIWFDANGSEVRGSEYSKVNETAIYLSQNPNATVAIDGTNDRANSVRNALLQAGVPAYKIHYGTFGDPKLQRDRQVQVLVSSR